MTSRWILVDPSHKNPDTGKPLFMDPDGKTTTDPGSAKTYSSEGDAKKDAEGMPDGWVPKPLDDYWPAKETDEPDVLEELTHAELDARQQRIDALYAKGASLDPGTKKFSLDGRSYDEDGNPD